MTALIAAIHASVQPTAEAQWWDIALDIEVDGRRVPLLPMLLAALRGLQAADFSTVLSRLAEMPLSLPDGRDVVLGKDRLESILAVIMALHGREHGAACQAA